MSGAEQCSLDIGPESRDGTTRRRFLPTPNTGGMDGGSNSRRAWVKRGGWTSSPEDSPVNPSPSPASAEHKPTTDGSGQSSPVSFAFYDPDTSSWRTFQGSLLDTEAWGTSLGTWPRAGMTRSGIAYRLRPSVPLTSVTESSWLPTPTRQSYGYNQQDSPGAAVRPSLQTMAARGMWPTPNVPGRTLKGAQDRRRDGGPSLAQVQLNSGATSGSLNPTWVEWLMGFPAGWTDLGDSATPSSRRSRSGSEDA